MQNAKLIDLTGTNRRLKVRRVDEESVIESVQADALAEDKWVWRAVHGGTVCNSYGYRAETEGLLVVVNPSGLAVAGLVRLSANKTTSSGIAGRIDLRILPLFDDRYSRTEVVKEARVALKAWHSSFWPAMTQLASVG